MMILGLSACMNSCSPGAGRVEAKTGSEIPVIAPQNMGHGALQYPGPSMPTGAPSETDVRRYVFERGPETAAVWMNRWVEPGDTMAIAGCHWAIAKAMWDRGDAITAYRWIARVEPSLVSLKGGNWEEQRAWFFLANTEEARQTGVWELGRGRLLRAAVEQKRSQLARDLAVSSELRDQVKQKVDAWIRREQIARLERGDWDWARPGVAESVWRGELTGDQAKTYRIRLASEPQLEIEVTPGELKWDPEGPTTDVEAVFNYRAEAMVDLLDDRTGRVIWQRVRMEIDYGAVWVRFLGESPSRVHGVRSRRNNDQDIPMVRLSRESR